MMKSLFIRPRIFFLSFLWSLPVLILIVLGTYALFQTGWLRMLTWVLPLIWLVAWLATKLWKAPKMKQLATLQPIEVPDFWTPKDVEAISIVEVYRAQIDDVDRVSILDANRFLRDAQELAGLLAQHYRSDNATNAFRSITLVEILAVIHLATEDLEDWMMENLPGSHLVTIGVVQSLPKYAAGFDTAQKLFFLAKAVMNPIAAMTYPIWRSSGAVAIEIQNEVVMAVYQRYLRQIGYYLIEMYSGRLKAGAKRYRDSFGRLTIALHQARGDVQAFNNVPLSNASVAIMGQVKAGKSSLINILTHEQTSQTSILPETRAVQRIEFRLPDSDKILTLLDTPGYNEADVTQVQKQEIAKASEAADIVMLVLAANAPARDADLQMLNSLRTHYAKNPHLIPPKIIGVLTHIDLLRPVREWSPPYRWRSPKSPKEQSIASAVRYCEEIFGSLVTSYACVYTGDVHEGDTTVADELVPCLVEHLPSGQSAAVLRAFYRQLSKERYSQLTKQVIGLAKTVGRQWLDG